MTINIGLVEFLLGVIALCLIVGLIIFFRMFGALQKTLGEVKQFTAFVNENSDQIHQLLQDSSKQLKSTQRLTDHLDDIAVDVKDISGATRSVVRQTLVQFVALSSGLRVGLRALQRNYDMSSNGTKHLRGGCE